MMNFTSIKILKRIFSILFPVVFWLLIWQLVSIVVGNSYFVPSVDKTAIELWHLLGSLAFYRVVFYTLLRVIAGLSLGIVFGSALAFLCNSFPFVYRVVKPIISVIKATPVASFIIILWIMMDGSSLAVFVALLMVMPIIWQNLMDGFSSVDKELIEVGRVYGFGYFKRMRYIILPALSGYFLPATVTASGLAWKSEIAAEIIAYTKNSVGQYINDAKNFFDTPKVFAWTVVVILLSIFIEKLLKLVLKRFSGKEVKSGVNNN